MTRSPELAVLFPDIRNLTVDDIRSRLEAIGNEDPERGHQLADELMRSALEMIRDGHPDPAGVARDVLATNEAAFPRWSA